MIPCNTMMEAGAGFLRYFHSKEYQLQDVSSVQICFPTQKQDGALTMVAVQSIIIDRQSIRSSSLVDKMVQWAMVNTNNREDEFLTRTVEGSSRRLTRCRVTSAMKDAARQCGVDPDRISTHSIRRNYASNLELNGCSNSSTKARAGWNSNSLVPENHYAIAPNIQGGLSLPKLLHSREFQKGYSRGNDSALEEDSASSIERKNTTLKSGGTRALRGDNAPLKVTTTSTY